MMKEKHNKKTKQAPAECLSLELEDHMVCQRVLDWIDRCDVAFQTGAPKLELQTTSGEPIFLESEEL